jgi:hypothetical protein
MARDSLPDAAFYTATDARHFIGAVALLNSLRLVGHREPFVLVDCGLEDWQRAAIAAHATLVDASRDLPPMLHKATGPLAHPAQVMAVLDADVIVTRSLAPLLEKAQRGCIVAFANNDQDRFFAEWSTLGLGAPERRPYVASGHLFVSAEGGLELLRVFDDAQRRIDLARTLIANDDLVVRASRDDPFYYPDMDVLNAVLATPAFSSRVVTVDYRLAPHAPFDGVSLDDAETLRCSYSDGVQPFLLHHVLRKPWLAATKSNVYSRLLPRVLTSMDVEAPLDPSRLPRRLTRARGAAADRRRADVQATLRTHLRGRLGIRPRIAAWQERRKDGLATASPAARAEGS